MCPALCRAFSFGERAAADFSFPGEILNLQLQKCHRYVR
jgi:hypothetical protein